MFTRLYWLKSNKGDLHRQNSAKTVHLKKHQIRNEINKGNCMET